MTDQDFDFGQKVFKAAADKLGMKPSALQGALWFAEKKNWANQGWSPLDLGDFRKELQITKLKHPTVDDLIRPRAKANLAEQVGMDFLPIDKKR